MKRLFLTLICIGTLSVSLCAAEAEGNPTVRPMQYPDVWLFWMSYYHNTNGKPVVLNAFMKGDSIVNGRKYVKTIVEETDTLLYRQEGDIVYWLDANLQNDVPLLDFSLHVGDEFTYSNDEKYVVVETGTLKEYSERNFYYNYEIFTPQMLRLRSLNNGEEDVWIEGIGSVQWGIIPACLAENLRSCKEKDVKPDYARVIHSPCSEFNVNEADYKLQFFSLGEDDFTIEDFKPVIDFAFINDTLHITGKAVLNCLSSYAECRLDRVNIDVSIHQISEGAEPECAVGRIVDIKIPGFEAGTYQVGVSGKDHVTLVCKGADDINKIENEKMRNGVNENATYDLSGRQMVNGKWLNGKLQKGIYIHDGKKVVLK